MEITGNHQSDEQIDENKNKYEVINIRTFNPRNSMSKAVKKEREKVMIYSCCNKDNCDAYKKGHCIMFNGLYGARCPYGDYKEVYGYTGKAKKCGELLEEYKNKYKKENNKLLTSVKFVCCIGDYIHLNLAYLDNWVNPIYNKETEKMFFSRLLLKKEYFTNEFIIELLKYQPKALFGGVISDYQKEDAPLFAWQLKKYVPQKYNEVLKEYPKIEELANQVSFIGDEVRVKTLDPGKVCVSANKKPIIWDGEYLRGQVKDIAIFGTLVEEEFIIKPTDETVVYVYDNDTVNENTIFENK